ncbi:MAG: HlyD family efflux transporter periplasmic adaptor subunit [Bacteroidota bacterium]
MMKQVPITAALLLLMTCSVWSCKDSDESETTKAQVSAKVVNNSLPTFQTITATQQDVQQSIDITGRVIPMQSVGIQAEVQGIVLSQQKIFREGVVFRKGDTLVRIDNIQTLENLKAQRSQFESTLVRLMADLESDYPESYMAWNSYLQNFDEGNILPELPEVTNERLRYFLSARNVFNLYHSIKSAEQNLPKFRIHAPFTGVVMQSNISPGALVTPQLRLGMFNQIGTYEVKATVSNRYIDRIKIGQQVQLHEIGSKRNYTASIQRIGKSIDPATQMVTVYLRTSGDGLRENLYLEGQIGGDTFEKVYQIPRSILTPQQQVYVIRDSTVRLKDVQVKTYTDNYALVTGLSEGDVIVNEVVDQPIEGIRAVANTDISSL